jgi:predicted ATPase
LAAEASVLSSITNGEFPHLFALREEMRNWRLLQLDPTLLRLPASATAAELLNPDGSNLAAVLARIKSETATLERPKGVLSDIVAELSALIPGVAALDAELDVNRSEYRVDLTMRDGLPFSSRVVSDGTLRVLALLTLLHDPRHRGLICFEEPENGVHPARLKQLILSLRDMVTRVETFREEDAAPLSQLFLNSHSPVVLSALVGKDGEVSEHDAVFLADSASIVDPAHQEVRRHTRLRRVDGPVQVQMDTELDHVPQQVTRREVERLLDTAQVEA